MGGWVRLLTDLLSFIVLCLSVCSEYMFKHFEILFDSSFCLHLLEPFLVDSAHRYSGITFLPAPVKFLDILCSDPNPGVILFWDGFTFVKFFTLFSSD